MKEIAFITSTYASSNFYSGGIKLNYILLQQLKKFGCNITLFTSKKFLDKKNLFQKILLISDFQEYKEFFDLTISDKAIVATDITYIHDHSYLFRQKMMFSPALFYLYKIFNYKKHLKRLKDFKNTKKNICNTSKVIVSSNILKQDMIENYGVNPDNLIIIPPPIESYKKRERNSQDIYTFGISTTGFVRKGGYITLNAIRKLKKKGYQFKVKFIYPSKNFFIDFLIKIFRIKKYCEFVPLYKDMSDFYYSIDCLLMPSLIEPFGMVTSEALSTGCPVITASHCGASDIIEDGKNGFIFQFNNNPSEELAKKMEAILYLSYERKEKMKDYCINSVKIFTEKHFAEKVLDCFTNHK